MQSLKELAQTVRVKIPTLCCEVRACILWTPSSYYLHYKYLAHHSKSMLCTQPLNTTWIQLLVRPFSRTSNKNGVTAPDSQSQKKGQSWYFKFTIDLKRRHLALERATVELQINTLFEVRRLTVWVAWSNKAHAYAAAVILNTVQF